MKTDSSQFIQTLLIPRFGAGLGAFEQWTELYLAYSEGAAQTATTNCAKNAGGVASFAGKQVSMSRSK